MEKKSRTLAWIGGIAGLLAAVGAFIPLVLYFLEKDDNNTVINDQKEPPAIRYMLNITGGSGSGQYLPGSQISISAASGSTNTQFTGWIAPASVKISDRNSPVTILTMPAYDVSLTAQFEEKVTTLRMTPDGSEPFRTGTVYKSGKVDGSYIGLGDRGRGKPFRGFVTFDLRSLPRGKKILRADLVMRRGGASGHAADPDTKGKGFFGSFVVEGVNIGNSLDKGDYSRPGLSLGEHPTNLFSRNWHSKVPIDVKSAVQAALNANTETITFRMRFLSEWDNDNESDSVTLDTRGDRLRIEIDYAG